MTSGRSSRSTTSTTTALSRRRSFADEREHRFIVADANHDSGITHDEYVAEYRARLMLGNPDEKTVERQMKQTDVRFGVLDSNKDGKISRAEYAHSGWRMFSEHDYTEDGAVSDKDNVEPRKPTGAVSAPARCVEESLSLAARRLRAS